ncbi:hypothetical protein QTO34_004062 [Cnephaeus nilssonii]|uniref:Uncharacterized protein n=1 Tax=Cnephaeus nilssonii TaxID=3371016 RepID=A0AA40LL88_CNENI|nr:hypothetical protein QTO34_004062 [Eptesicus nilssonii]
MSFSTRSSFSNNHWPESIQELEAQALGSLCPTPQCAGWLRVWGPGWRDGWTSGVRSLKADKWRPESKIRKHLEKKGPQVRDWGHYFKTNENLRAQIFVSSLDNGHTVLQIENAYLIAGDFRVKSEIELAMP